MTPEDAQELRELQDPDTWDWEKGELHPPRPARSAVVAVRFTGDEFDRVATAAEQAGVRLTDWIRQAALAHSVSQIGER